MDMPNNIRDILKRLITDRGVSPRDIEKETDVSANGIYKILNGEVSKPRMETVKKLADYFGVTPAQLLGEAPLPGEGDAGTDGPGSFEIARRLEALEKKIAAGDVNVPALTAEDRERLNAKYIRRGLVALRTEKLDAAALDALYFVLWKVEQTEEGTYGGIPKTGSGEGEGS
jgi:transcriptional regulator with XRE-family HTH domain